jgi:hypothetical protein
MAAVKIGAAVASYRTDGYVVLRQAIERETLDAAQQLLDARERAWQRKLRRLPDGRSWLSQAGEITFTARLAGTAPRCNGC